MGRRKGSKNFQRTWDKPDPIEEVKAHLTALMGEAEAIEKIRKMSGLDVLILADALRAKPKGHNDMTDRRQVRVVLRPKMKWEKSGDDHIGRVQKYLEAHHSKEEARERLRRMSGIEVLELSYRLKKDEKKRKKNLAMKGLGLYKRKNGKSWYIDIRVRGQRYTECFGLVSKEFAISRAKKIKTDLYEGRSPMGNLPFSVFLDRYLQNRSANPRDEISAKHLKEFFRKKPVSRIGQMDVEQYKKHRRDEIEAKKGKGASCGSINLELSVFSHALNVAKLPNPTKGVKRFDVCERGYALDDEEERRLFEAVRKLYPDTEPFFRFAINTGYFLGEILALRNSPEMVNFEKAFICIPRIRKGKRQEVEPPMNDILIGILQKAIEINQVGPGERIFPYTSSWIHKRWGRIRRKAGLDDLRIDNLRYTFAIRKGKSCPDPYALQRVLGLGWKTMEKKYIHVSMARKRILMARMDNR